MSGGDPSDGGHTHKFEGPIPEEWGLLPHLQQLKLSFCELKCPIPESIGFLSSLERLDLDHNQLNGALPRSFVHFSRRLQVLNLSENQLQGDDDVPPLFFDMLCGLERLDLNNYSDDAEPKTISNWLVKNYTNLGNLTQISLARQGLIGAIPRFVKISNLRELSLEENGLTGTIPASLGEVKTLTHLSLSMNKLEGGIPSSLGNLTRLRHLTLDSNELVGCIPASFSQLGDLAKLELQGNGFSGPIPAVGASSNLHTLIFSGNKFTSPDLPAALGQLHRPLSSSLEVLWIGGNSLGGDFCHDTVALCSKLTHLGFFDMGLEGTLPESIGNLTNLMKISLSLNNFTGGIPESIGQLVNVVKLDLSQNKLTGPIPKAIGKMASLQELYLFENELSGPIPPSIAGASCLEVLVLAKNKLGGAVPNLRPLKKLAKFNVKENALRGAKSSRIRRWHRASYHALAMFFGIGTESVRTKLKKHLPNCEVFMD